MYYNVYYFVLKFLVDINVAYFYALFMVIILFMYPLLSLKVFNAKGSLHAFFWILLHIKESLGLRKW